MWADDRERMVEDQLRRRGISDERVLAAMASVPRELFVPERVRDRAYDDAALPIGGGQTISQPFMVARSARLALRGDERVLDVGTGSGYQAAVLAELAGEVHTIERSPTSPNARGNPGAGRLRPGPRPRRRRVARSPTRRRSARSPSPPPRPRSPPRSTSSSSRRAPRRSRRWARGTGAPARRAQPQAGRPPLGPVPVRSLVGAEGFNGK